YVRIVWWSGCMIRAFFFFQAEDGIRYDLVTGVQTCALPISFVWRGVSDQAPQRLDDERDSTLDLVNGARLGRVERRRDPQLRQRLLSRPPSVLQEPAELRDAPPAACLRYV